MNYEGTGSKAFLTFSDQKSFQGGGHNYYIQHKKKRWPTQVKFM